MHRLSVFLYPNLTYSHSCHACVNHNDIQAFSTPGCTSRSLQWEIGMLLMCGESYLGATTTSKQTCTCFIIRIRPVLPFMLLFLFCFFFSLYKSPSFRCLAVKTRNFDQHARLISKYSPFHSFTSAAAENPNFIQNTDLR